MPGKNYGLIVKDRSADYTAGHRRAGRACIAWLHRRAEQMDDPKAIEILNSAAFSLGVDLSLARKNELPHPAGVDEFVRLNEKQ